MLTSVTPYVLTWLPVVVLALVSGIFIWRRLYLELPYFFLYASAAWLIGVARYLAGHVSHGLFFYTYWISELAGAVLVTLALYEVFLRRLFYKFQKVRFYRSLFPIFAFVTLVITTISAAGAHDKYAAFLAASQAFDFMRTAFLVFFTALMLLMGRAWTRYDLGIALGFGLQAAVALVNSAVRIRLHYRPPALDIAEFVAYDIACLIWLITFWKAEEPATISADDHISPEMVEQARSWESSLKDFVHPKKPKL